MNGDHSKRPVELFTCETSLFALVAFGGKCDQPFGCAARNGFENQTVPEFQKTISQSGCVFIVRFGK